MVVAIACAGFARYLFEGALRGAITVNGQRYTVLGDDAMISLRYAYNLANANGLAWNPGERVEGMTNRRLLSW
jgi:hypothetical protein